MTTAANATTRAILDYLTLRGAFVFYSIGMR